MTPMSMPTQLGRYKLLRPLGQGGMGAVWVALDTRLQREVALKLPLVNAETNPIAIERFQREARIAASIDHPNFCPVHDVGDDQGYHYYVMPIIAGRPLVEYLQSGEPWPVDQAAQLILSLASALAELHARGIVHRDLKPANVMVRPDGSVVLMDFGLARSFEGTGEGLTGSGQVLGTPAYMAPEQVSGDATKVGPAADVWALGVMLYQLLAGVLPFTGTGFEVLGRVLHMEPPSPSTHRSDGDAWLDEDCLRALSKDPRKRPESMAAFAAQLSEACRGPGHVAQDRITCRCGKRLKLPAAGRGRKLKCPACGEALCPPEVPTQTMSALPERDQSRTADCPTRQGNRTAGTETTRYDMPAGPLSSTRDTGRRVALLVTVGLGCAAAVATVGYFAWVVFLHDRPSGEGSASTHPAPAERNLSIERKYFPDACTYLNSTRTDAWHRTEYYRIAIGIQNPTYDLPDEHIERVTEVKNDKESVTIVTAVKDMTAAEVRAVLAQSAARDYVEEAIGLYRLHAHQRSGQGPDMSFAIPESKIVLFGPAETLRKVLRRNSQPGLPPRFMQALAEAHFGSTQVLVNIPTKEGVHVFRRAPFMAEAYTVTTDYGSDVTTTMVLYCKDDATAESVRNVVEMEMSDPEAFNMDKARDEGKEKRQNAMVSRNGSTVIWTTSVKRQTMIDLLKKSGK